MKLKKIFIGIFTLIFGMFFVCTTFADEEIPTDEIIDPDDYDPIYIDSNNYTSIVPQTINGTYSAVYVGCFKNYEVVLGEPTLVTDDGLAANVNAHRELSLYDITEKTKSQLISCGVTTIGLEIRINLWELDDGYQDIYLQNAFGSNLSSYLHLSHDYNEPKIYDIFAEFPISSVGESFALKFDASGSWDDDWKYNSITLTFYVSRETRVNSSIVNLGVVSSLYWN